MTTPTDLAIEYVAIESLNPFSGNPRKITQRDLAALVRSIERFGFVDPVIARKEDRMVIGGHQRLKAASIALDAGRGVSWAGNPPQVPVIFLDIPQDQAVALNVTLNKITGTWDQELLATLLAQIEAMPSVDLADCGFSDTELKAVLASVNTPVVDLGPQLDKAGELQVKWGTALGQVWEIGKHRLMCGDGTSQAAHEMLLRNVAVDLVLTDPPYAVGVEYGAFQDTEVNVRLLIQTFIPLALKWPTVLLTPGQVCMWDYPRPSWLLAWVHPAGTGSNPWGFTCLNPVLAYGRDPYLRRGLGRRPDSLVLVATREKEVTHPVVKPLEVWKWLLERGSPREGEVVLDPFLGSGTTMVAAEQLGRICYGMEIEPKYVAVTLERMAGMGLKPRLL